jgi:UTP--glucose-1-phosphate uridylyltransferase
VLTPLVMDLLERLLHDAPTESTVPLSPALAELAQRERYLAMELKGTRHDIGVKYGLLTAQLAHCLTGRDRDLILTELLQLIADTPPSSSDAL